MLRGRGYPTPGIRSRLYVKGGDAPVMATVCHGPLGRGPMSSLSSFRTTLVEKVSRLFPCVFSHPGPRRGVLELSFCSPFTGPAQPHAPNVTGPIQAEGMNGLLKEYHRESRPNCFNYTAATLMLSTFNMDAINQCDNSHWGGEEEKTHLPAPVFGCLLVSEQGRNNGMLEKRHRSCRRRAAIVWSKVCMVFSGVHQVKTHAISTHSYHPKYDG